MEKLEAELRKHAAYFVKGVYPDLIQETFPTGLEAGEVYIFAVIKAK